MHLPWLHKLAKKKLTPPSWWCEGPDPTLTSVSITKTNFRYALAFTTFVKAFSWAHLFLRRVTWVDAHVNQQNLTQM